MQVKKRLYKTVPVAILGLSLLGLYSCGGDSNNDSNDTPQQQQEEQQDEGVYSVKFDTINAGVGGNQAVGVGAITISGDTIRVKVAMTGTPSNITHIQHIHSAKSCPTSAADVNNDGFVDVVEGVPAYGPILIPLDSSIYSQSNMGSFPRSNGAGAFVYNRSASLSKTLSDLHAVDPDTTDAVIKLEPGENLNLEGRHIVVHGVAANTTLPSTVASLGGAPAQATLPIACGMIVRKADTGGTTGTTTGGTTGTTTGGATGTTTGGTTGTTTGGTTGTTTGGTTGTTTGGTTGTTTGGTTGGITGI